ncbi:protein of unknown function [Chitinophaga costaii]|uniref:DUF4302 domain-containing protein n=1 Tax=Chitinophaga costaii TaxID=1335309 RepID=A0A1C4EF28_9BACT|nr:DUF4302 domain-containing protein [Chitinophaga costaii]PUZ23864.1 DUF4302 domain-containing protein [Chitinophaga costaii]SCC42218.1 protein of unknown function [Chitinophaga costaii]
MKKYLLYTIIFCLSVTACKKNNDKADLGDPDKRLNTVLADYQSLLVASPNGWRALIWPNPEENEVMYPFWFRFMDSNRVETKWENRPAFVSSYRFKALQRPELIFDTYTYLHELANPETGTLPNTASGKGLTSDFEFEVIAASEDSIVLKGKYNGSNATLIKAAVSDTEHITVPGYKLARTYLARVHRILYKTTAAEGTISNISNVVIRKTFNPLHTVGVVAAFYADLGSSDWSYLITFDETTQKITKVEPDATMSSEIQAGSFQVLENTYDTSTGNVFLKTSYTNSSGAERVTEETFTLVP